MSYSVIGNDSIGLYHTDWYEVEVEDEDTGDYYETEIEGDFVREIEFVGYTFTADENSKSASVEMYYYFRNPTSEYYWAVPGILKARTLEWVAISSSNA